MEVTLGIYFFPENRNSGTKTIDTDIFLCYDSTVLMNSKQLIIWNTEGRMAQLVEPTGQVIKLPVHEYLK